jgi:hypothetical protein
METKMEGAERELIKLTFSIWQAERGARKGKRENIDCGCRCSSVGGCTQLMRWRTGSTNLNIKMTLVEVVGQSCFDK